MTKKKEVRRGGDIQKKGEISFFSFLFAPHNKHTRVRVLFRALCSNQIERKNGILRVRIDISGSLSGFEYCGENEECGTKSIVVIDACFEDESDSVVVDLLCD